MRARSKKRKPRRFRFYIFLFFCALILIGGYALLALPLWKITDISVSGTRMLNADEIRDLAGLPLSANLFLTSFARTRRNLSKITAIQDFYIYRLPPGTVLIKIKEKVPIAVVVIKNQSAIVDRSGFILNRNPNLSLNVPNLTDLPIISGLGTSEAAGEDKLNPQISQLISEIVAELAPLLGAKQMKLEIGSFAKISLMLDDILLVKIGRNENVRRKMAVFKVLLSQVENRWPQVEYIDVRYPNNPAIKFK